MSLGGVDTRNWTGDHVRPLGLGLGIAGLRVTFQTVGLVLLILVLAGALTAIVFQMRRSYGISIAVLTRDVTAVANLPPYVGLLSQIALLLWPVGVTACFLAASVVDDRTRRAFFTTAGVLTLLLALDDAFLFHEWIFPRMGVPEIAVLGVYAALFLFLIVRFYAVILQTQYALLILACLGCFGVSVVMDMGPWIPLKQLIEEWTKLVGIIGWSSYFFLEARALAAREGRLAAQPVRPAHL